MMLKQPFMVSLLCLALQAWATPVSSDTLDTSSRIHHELAVTLIPGEQRLEVEDIITLPEPPSSPHGPRDFLLHTDLKVESADPDYVLELLPLPPKHAAGADTAPPLRSYRLRPAAGKWPQRPAPRLRFAGNLSPLLQAELERDPAGFPPRPGSVADQGIALLGNSYWVPTFDDELVTFRLTVTMPADWNAVSQGERIIHEQVGNTRRVRWDSPEPMENIYLVAGRFTEYTQATGEVTAYAFLRQPDPALATRYLEATAQYIDLYRRLIGPYPYRKFALVENFWESGYGMPSFTLLGSRVIRLPFILHSSYPHEILHNWWGNSVYVDYAQGNWCEGLTAYLADHLIKEQRGQGQVYRRDTLEKYRNYVTTERDFPLTAFRARHSAASQAVGYGKTLMMWHMLRLKLGDPTFVEGLRQLYRQYRFREAAYRDIEKVFSEVAKTDLTPFFRQWTQRVGAPKLSFEAERLDDQRIGVTVRQTQADAPYQLEVPLAITVAGEKAARLFPLRLEKRESRFEFPVPAPALRADLDPYFDVFRRLDKGEIPATLSELFGAERVTFILPDAAGPVDFEAWQDMIQSWSRRREKKERRVAVVNGKALKQLPETGAVWILGRQNPWRQQALEALAEHGAGLEGGMLRLDGSELPADSHSFVFAVRDPHHEDLTLGWIGIDRKAAVPGFARKLPHYGKYSYLAFTGDAPDNVAKGQWAVTTSPLVKVLAAGNTPGSLVPRATLPNRAPLAQLLSGTGN